MREQIAEERPVAEAPGDDVGNQAWARPGRSGRRRVGAVEPVVQGLHPGRPLPRGQLEEDLLAGLEVAQQGRLVDAGQAGDTGQAHGADAFGQRELAGGGQDLLPPLLLLLRTAGAQKRLTRLRRRRLARRHHPSLSAMKLSHQRFVISATSVYYLPMAIPARDRPREREPVPCPRSSS